MITPVQQNEALLADIASSRPSDLSVWWLGQSGFLIRHQDIHFLFDPYLSDTLTEKYAATDKPHVRMTERVIDPGQLHFVSVATSTHVHTDHLDHGTLLPLRQVSPALQLVLPRAIRETALERLGDWGDNYLWMNAGESIDIGSIRISAIPAAHNTLQTDEQGNHHFLGYLVELGGWKIFHSGDTLRYDGMADWIDGPVDLAILPINGNQPERRVAGNLDGAEAAALAQQIGAKIVIPCHFEMFEFNTATPELFSRTCREIGQDFRVLKAGEKLTLPPAEGTA
ncbi:MAG: MBL fold metallo-hydrolase [Verrucomicrobiota bacterium]